MLAAHMPRLEAEEELLAGNVPDNRVWQVVYNATGGDRDKADDALANRLLERMRQG